MNEVLRARLTGRAARFVHLLQDYGHLDEAQSDELLIAVAEEAGEGVDLIDLPQVKRIAAAWLFEAHPEGEDGPDVLAEDWPFLFY